MIIEILCGALVIVVGLMAYIISNLNKKISVYETWVDTDSAFLRVTIANFNHDINRMHS